MSGLGLLLPVHEMDSATLSISAYGNARTQLALPNGNKAEII